MDKAACRGLNQYFFSPHVCEAACDLKAGCLGRKEKGRTLRIATAKQICKTCPVKKECLQWALDTELEHGVAGGLTDRERTKLRRTRAC